MSTQLSSSRHGPGDAYASSGAVKSVKPPRNSNRLASGPAASSSTLGPAIDINFKIPSLPRQRTSSSLEPGVSHGRRPLKMVEEGNIPASSEEDGTTPTPALPAEATPNRLKRLSLIARPSPLAESPNLRQRDEGDRPASARLSADASRASRTSEDGSSTPRSMRMRSSISYSPASAPGRAARPGLMSPEASRCRLERNETEGDGLDGGAKGETWSDRSVTLPLSPVWVLGAKTADTRICSSRSRRNSAGSTSSSRVSLGLRTSE